MKHFDSKEVEIFLKEYKLNPCEITLDNLYNSIDHIVLAVTSKIATSFSKKYPADFEDIQQNVRITIYRILPKLASISITGDQIIAIVVKACVWKFKSSYARFKKKTPVQGTMGDWMPDNEVAVEVPLEVVLGADNGKQTRSGKDWDEYTRLKYEVKTTATARVWINPSQFERLYLQRLPEQVLNLALSKNRFREKDTLVKFCLQSLIEGRDASTILISKKWDTSSPVWWINYSTILLRLAIIDTIK
jgi:hypothetical protein